MYGNVCDVQGAIHYTEATRALRVNFSLPKVTCAQHPQGATRVRRSSNRSMALNRAPSSVAGGVWKEEAAASGAREQEKRFR